MKNSKEELDAMLTDYAYSTKRHLEDVGAIRRADNLEPDTVSVDDICEAIGIPDSLWSSVKERMLELGMPIALQYFGGYYIGKPGEQATIIKHSQAQILGVAKSCQNAILLQAKAGTIEEANKWAREHWGRPLDELPKMLKALGVPLPHPLHNLLESGIKQEELLTSA